MPAAATTRAAVPPRPSGTRGVRWRHTESASSDSDALRESLAALTGFFVGDGTLEETLQRVADLAASTVEHADMTAITLLVDDQPTTAVFTDERAPEIDRAQYASGSGPCLDAFRDGEVRRIESTGDEERWPEFSTAAHGVRSVLSLPLVAAGEGVGALNLYSGIESGFDDEDEATATAFADPPWR
jgi:GAF domain-containing protein